MPTRKEWQVVEIPLGLFDTDEPFHSVDFKGSFDGLFYLDAVELVLQPEDLEDLAILGDDLSPGWEVSGRNLENLAPTQPDVVHAGSAACAVQGKKSFAGWTATFQTSHPFFHFDYETLRFALHLGDLALVGNERFAVSVAPGSAVSLLAEDRIDIEEKKWQLVEIPLADFAVHGPIESVNFSGNFPGTFYLDDLALGANRLPSRAPTAVLEEHLDPLPQAFALQQNYPNPFNSETVVHFALPTAEEVELALFNLIGQRVATLARGWREAGSHALRWDGRGDGGHALASGVYLYRLQVGSQQVETRKLMLLR